MEISIFLAKFWGWYLLIFFFILSINPIRIKQIFEDIKDRKFLNIVAFIAIIIGLLNIIFHNVWAYDWTMIITIIGWMALGKGMFLFAFPRQTIKLLNHINLRLIQVVFGVLFLVGLYLLNEGYNLVSY